MTLVKTSILSFIATAIKMLAAIVINKAVAFYIGPSAGQFKNLLTGFQFKVFEICVKMSLCRQSYDL